jgi:hypothetical protein
MTGISNASAMALVAAFCQLIAVVWLVGLCLRAVFGGIDVPGFVRGLAVVVILGQVLPAVTGSLQPSPLSEGQPIVAAYQQLAVALGGAAAGEMAPGTALVVRSVAISAGIWSGIVTSGLILLPVVAWMMVVAVELVQGAALPALALRIVLWWLLWSVCAGGVGTTISQAAYQLATAVVQSAIAGVHQQGATSAPAPSAIWSVPEIVAAATASALPATLSTLTTPLVHSLQRVLPPDGAAYQRVAASGFIGAQAQGGLRGIYLVSATGADPHESFSREFPSLDPLLIHNVTPSLYLNAPDLDAWLARALVDADGSVIDGTGMVVGVVPIGDCTALAHTLSSSYAALVARERTRVERQLAQVTQGQSGGLATSTWAALLRDRIGRLDAVQAPTLVLLANAPLAGVVAARYQSYYAAVLAQRPDLITAHQVAQADAWGVMCLVAGADHWPASSTGASLPSDPFARLVCASSLRAGMEAPPLNPDERVEVGRSGTLLGRLSAGLVQVLVDSSLSLAALVLAAAVWLLAPLVVQLGFYQIALGCFVLNLAYPVAAFLALFPRQASALIEWSKAVFWVALCIPFIVIGISLATPPDAASVITPVLAVSARLAGGALGGLAASAVTGPGAITGTVVTMLTGMIMILMSWWFATLMLHPGLSGMASATRWMMQASATLAASAAHGTGLMARGISAGLRVAGRLGAAADGDAGGGLGPAGARPVHQAHPGIARGALGALGASGASAAGRGHGGGTPAHPTPRSETLQALQATWSRVRALADPAVAGAAWSAAVGGAFTDAVTIIDAAVQARAPQEERSPPPPRPSATAARAQGVSDGDQSPTCTPPSPPAAGALGRDAARRCGYEAGMQALGDPPQSHQRAVATRWLDQASQAADAGAAGDAARQALWSAVQSGDWPLIGRAAGLVRTTATAPQTSPSRPAPAGAISAGLVLGLGVAHSQGIADAVCDHLAAAYDGRARSLGLPSSASTAITVLDDPAARALSRSQAEATAAAVSRDLANGRVAAAMVGATLGATQALRSGDATVLERSDGQLLSAAGAALSLSSLDTTYEHAISSACRGLQLMRTQRVQPAQRTAHAQRSSPAQRSQGAADDSAARPAPSRGDEREDALQRLLAAERTHRPQQPGGDHAP